MWKDLMYEVTIPTSGIYAESKTFESIDDAIAFVQRELMCDDVKELTITKI